MREILFRGKRSDGCGWMYGDYEHFHAPGGLCVYISEWGVKMREVVPETVGQYTGLTDKNGKKIFDGDVIRYFHEDSFPKAVVRFGMTRCSHVGFYLEWEAAEPCLRQDIGFWVNEREIEVIGNIHDNPELLEALNGQ